MQQLFAVALHQTFAILFDLVRLGGGGQLLKRTLELLLDVVQQGRGGGGQVERGH